jgi:hypothetical protein
MLVQKPLKYFWIGTNNEIISFKNSRNLIMRYFFKLLNLYGFRRIKNNSNFKGIRCSFLSFKNSIFKLLQVCNSEQSTNFRFEYCVLTASVVASALLAIKAAKVFLGFKNDFLPLHVETTVG